MLFKINFFRFLLLFFVVAAWSSCEDQGQITVVEGRVTNLTTGSPATGASVVLWIGTDNDFTFGSSSRIFSTKKTTDSTGNYSLTFFNNRSNNHFMQVVPNAFFDCSLDSEIKIGERNMLNFSVLPQDTLLELHFIQTDFDENPDSVAVSVNFDSTCGSTPFGTNNYVLSTNLNVDSTLQVFTQPSVSANLDLEYFEEGILLKTDRISLMTGTELSVVEVEY